MNRIFMLDWTVPLLVYRSEKGHWPKDYSELSAFVEQSGGCLHGYDLVEFAELPGDTLQVYVFADGYTNRMTMTFPPPDQNK